MTDSRVTPQAEAAWRLSIQACTNAGGVPLGSFNWPWALGLALAEIERQRLLCQPLQDEIDRLRAVVESVESLHSSDGYARPTCYGCGRLWPCETRTRMTAAVPVGTDASSCEHDYGMRPEIDCGNYERHAPVGTGNPTQPRADDSARSVVPGSRVGGDDRG